MRGTQNTSGKTKGTKLNEKIGDKRELDKRYKSKRDRSVKRIKLEEYAWEMSDGMSRMEREVCQILRCPPDFCFCGCVGSISGMKRAPQRMKLSFVLDMLE